MKYKQKQVDHFYSFLSVITLFGNLRHGVNPTHPNSSAFNLKLWARVWLHVAFILHRRSRGLAERTTVTITR